MRYRRTPQDLRITYKQYDENGHVIAEIIPHTQNGRTEFQAPEWVIRQMHLVDDAEVRENCKEIQLPKYLQESRKKEREEVSRKFEAEYGYKPDPKTLDELAGSLHRTFTPVDKTPEGNYGNDTDSDSDDKSPVQEALAVRPFEEEETPFSIAAELIETAPEFTDRERELFRYFCRAGRMLEESGRKDPDVTPGKKPEKGLGKACDKIYKGAAADALNISKGRVTQLLKSIREKLRAHPEYTNFFRT